MEGHRQTGDVVTYRGDLLPQSKRATDMALKVAPAQVRRLMDRGWTFAESPDLAGSGTVVWWNQQIVLASKIVKRQSSRDLYYVTEHEIGHALDFDAGIPSRLLGEVIDLNPQSAQEALGEAVAYHRRSSSSERSWIRSSIAWHLRRSRLWRYSWGDVRNPATVELASLLMEGPTAKSGFVFKWDGDRIVRV